MHFAHIGETGSIATNSYNIVAASIACLFWLCLPLAIVWIVAFGVIYSSKGFSNRSFTHVLKEVLKRISPPRADFNPPATIMVKTFVVWVKASAFHGTPRIICFGISSAVFWVAKPISNIGRFLSHKSVLLICAALRDVSASPRHSYFNHHLEARN